MPEETTGQEANEGQEQGSEGTQNTHSEAVETNAETTSTNIDWSSVDATAIPEDILKQHPAFKEVLSESIGRRQEIKDLKAQLSSNSNENEQGTQGDDANSDLLAKLANLEGVVTKLVDMQVQSETNATRKQLAATHNVPEARIKYITGDSFEEMEASAKELGNPKGGVEGNTSAGNAGGSGGTNLSALKQRIRAGAEDKGLEAPTIFEPGMQRVRGGGAVLR